jgi:hypothetical protein
MNTKPPVYEAGLLSTWFRRFVSSTFVILKRWKLSVFVKYRKTLAETYMILINPLTTTINLLCIHTLSPYLTHRVHFHWKAQPMKDVQGNISYLLQESNGIYKYTAWTKCGVLRVKHGGTYRNYIPLTNNRVVNNEHWCKHNTKNNIDRFWVPRLAACMLFLLPNPF